MPDPYCESGLPKLTKENLYLGEMVVEMMGEMMEEMMMVKMMMGANIEKVKKKMKVYSVMIGMMFFTLCWFAFAEV